MITKKNNKDDLFKFTVQSCWATIRNDPNKDHVKDVFFDEQCHLDGTVDFEHNYATETNNFFKY